MKTDLTKWVHVGYYGNCRIFAQGIRRILVDKKDVVKFGYIFNTNKNITL